MRSTALPVEALLYLEKLHPISAMAKVSWTAAMKLLSLTTFFNPFFLNQSFGIKPFCCINCTKRCPIDKSIDIHSPGLLALMRQALLADEQTHDVNVVGLVSDTHGVLEDATILALCQATSMVLHAGDVGDKRHKSRLSASQVIAKLEKETGKDIFCVAGNVDEGCTELPAWQSLNISGKKIVVMHISGFPPNNTAESEELVKSEAPDIVVFGHSHVPGVQKHDNIIYINRSAGPRRFKLPRCISLLSIHKSGEVMVEFVCVSNLPRDIIALPTPFMDPVSTFQVQDSMPKSRCVSLAPAEENTDVEESSVDIQCKKRRKCKL